MVESMAVYFSIRPAADPALPDEITKNLMLQNGQKVLKANFQHFIKKDKKGQNSASVLLRVLYKHLISLVEQNAVLVDEAIHKDLTFDRLITYIRDQARFKSDGSGILIACQLIKKTLRGLSLITKSGMDDDERLTIKLI